MSLFAVVALVGVSEPAVEAGIIDDAERQTVLDADVVRDEVIQVDAFDPATFTELRG